MTQTQQEISMLRNELEMLMLERDGLLRVSGAAALFVAELESVKLPEIMLEVAEMLAESLNELTEDTLQDALNAVKEKMQLS